MAKTPRLADGTPITVLGPSFSFPDALEAARKRKLTAAQRARIRFAAEEVALDLAQPIVAPAVAPAVASTFALQAFDALVEAVETRITRAGKQVIQTAYRVGSIDGYGMVLAEGASKAEQQVFWMCISDDRSCEDCLELHGAVMLTSEFQARYGRTRCNGNCRCMPLPVDPEAQVEYIDKYRDVLPLENLRAIGEAVE